MDAIPCAFIDAVLSVEDLTYISEFIKLRSKLWTDLARNHLNRQVELLDLFVDASDGKCFYRVTSTSGENFSLLDLQKLKYKRGRRLKVTGNGKQANGTRYSTGILHFIRNVAFPLGVTSLEVESLHHQELFHAIFEELLTSGYIFAEVRFHALEANLCLVGIDFIYNLLRNHVRSNFLKTWSLPKLLPAEFYCARFQDLFAELAIQIQLRHLYAYHMNLPIGVIEALLKSWEERPRPLGFYRTVNRFPEDYFLKRGFVKQTHTSVFTKVYEVSEGRIMVRGALRVEVCDGCLQLDSLGQLEFHF